MSYRVVHLRPLIRARADLTLLPCFAPLLPLRLHFVSERLDAADNGFRSCGKENREFDENGLMARRFASINDLPIAESERKFLWAQGRRPDGHAGLSELGL